MMSIYRPRADVSLVMGDRHESVEDVVIALRSLLPSGSSGLTVFIEGDCSVTHRGQDSLLEDVLCTPGDDPHCLALLAALRPHRVYLYALNMGAITREAIDSGRIDFLVGASLLNVGAVHVYEHASHPHSREWWRTREVDSVYIWDFRDAKAIFSPDGRYMMEGLKCVVVEGILPLEPVVQTGAFFFPDSVERLDIERCNPQVVAMLVMMITEKNCRDVSITAKDIKYYD